MALVIRMAEPKLQVQILPVSPLKQKYLPADAIAR